MSYPAWPGASFRAWRYLGTAVIALCAAVGSSKLQASPIDMAYAGRMTDANGRPVEGPVTIEVRFFQSLIGGNPLVSPPLMFANVSLDDGLFRLSLPLASTDLNTIFPAAGTATYIEVKDVTHGRTYPRQAIGPVPYAYKVPVDDKTIRFDSDGQLTVGPSAAPGANQFLTKDGSGNLIWATASQASQSIAGGAVSAVAPVNGQVLKYVAGTWVPSADAGIQKTGDTGVGSIGLSSGATLGLGTYSNATETTLVAGLTAADKGKTWFNTDINQIRYWNGSVAGTLGTAGAGLQSIGGLTANDQLLAVDTTGTSLAWQSAVDTHTLHVPLANATGVAAGLISKAEYDTFNAKQPAITSSSDLTTGSVSTAKQGAVVIHPFDTGATKTGELRFKELSVIEGNYVGLKGPDAIPGAAGVGTIWTLPATDGTSGQALTTNGGGILAWGTIPSPSTTETLTNKTIDATTNTITNVDNTSIKTGAAIDQAKISGLTSDLAAKAALGGQAGAVTIGTNDASALTLETNNTTRLTIDSSGYVGVGGTPSVVANLSAYIRSPAMTANGTSYHAAFETNARDLPISAGVTDSGYRIGLRAESYVNTSAFAGTLSEQYGVLSRVGSNSANPTGTIINSYALYLENLDGGATVTNKYGLYQSNSTAKNYFAGSLGIGTTTPAHPISVIKEQNAGTYVHVSNVATGVATVAGFYATNDSNGGVSVGVAGSGYSSTVLYRPNFGTLATDSSLAGLSIGTAGAGDPLIFSTAATERMRIDGTGKIGIGTTTPVYPLHIAGVGGSASTLMISDTDAPVDSKNFVITTLEGKTALQANNDANSAAINFSTYDHTNGFVGIGSTSPLSVMHVKGTQNADFGLLRLESSLNYAGISFYSPNAVDQTNARNWQMQSNYNSYGDFAILRSTTYNGAPTTPVMAFDRTGNVGIGMTNPTNKVDIRDAGTADQSAAVNVIGTAAGAITKYGTWSQLTGATTTNIAGLFAASGATNNYGLVVSAGSVGIGTATPAYLLTVVHNNPNAFGISGASANSVGMLINNTTGSGHSYSIYSSGASGPSAVGSFGIFDNTASTNRLTISPAGNVGIGTTTPQSALQVTGYVQLDLTSGAPIAGDCDAAAEYGRMKAETGAIRKLWVCTSVGWLSTTLN